MINSYIKNVSRYDIVELQQSFKIYHHVLRRVMVLFDHIHSYP